MNRFYLIFTCIWTIQLSYAQYETNETAKLYRQDTVSTYPSSPPPDFKIYGNDYRYAIQQTSYAIISGDDEMSIIGDKIVSSGIVILKNDTLLCVEDNTNTTILFKRMDEYRLEVTSAIPYYTSGIILYLRNVIGKDQKKTIFWKNKMIENQIFISKNGFMSISHEKGIAQDTIFKTWEDIKKSPIMLE
jgi:hypothetical protein